MKDEGGSVKFVPHLQPWPLFEFLPEFLLSFSLSFFFVARKRLKLELYD